MNIVRVNEKIFEQFGTDEQCGNCWSFTYARKDYANLKGGKDKCCIHVYMEDFTTSRVSDSVGFLDYVQHSYTLKLLIDSKFDIQIFNELEPEDAKSKFADYIEPLIDCFPLEYEKAICGEGFKVVNSTIRATYNRKDRNKDGINFQITIRDEYSD